MEQKIDQMINNQTVMLREMRLMRKDLNKVTNDVAELKEGQARLEVRVTSLEEGQEELKKGQKELIERVTLLEKGQESLNKKVDFILDDNKYTKENLAWLTKEYLHNKDKVETRLERIETQIA